MKNKKFMAILIASMLTLTCLSFAGCKDDTDSQKNSSNSSNNNYNSSYDEEDEWTDNH